jgi:2,4-dienoyl-CoA reductase-like NADH-dependent reductase (Old Yellow Enzyme family)
MNDVKSLFKPFELSDLQLRNRIVMPAMTRNFGEHRNVWGPIKNQAAILTGVSGSSS